jgi:hypothetical protein
VLKTPSTGLFNDLNEDTVPWPVATTVKRFESILTSNPN